MKKAAVYTTFIIILFATALTGLVIGGLIGKYIGYDIGYEQAIRDTSKGGAVTAVDDTESESSFNLDLFSGGSLFGNTFEISIDSDSNLTYKETKFAGAEMVKFFNKKLTNDELNNLKSTIKESKLLTVESQNFTEKPLIPDQGRYRLTLSLNGEANEVECGIAVNEPSIDCQKQIKHLINTLNSILNTNIY